MPSYTPAQYKGFLDELQKLAASKQRMAVPQTRSGRRSMRVDTLLKKDRDGTLYKKNWHDELPGGLADKKKPQDFGPKALAEGEKVEREHTSSPHIAEEITMDHLTEHPGYYPALRKMETKLEQREKHAADEASLEDLTPTQMAALRRRFSLLSDALRNQGVLAGTAHKRIVIPKDKLTESDIKHLGFQPVSIAIPEAGQDQFSSYRNPDNLFHIHSHPEGWTMHEDAHPSSTMLALKAHGVQDKAKALISGAPHVSEEGLPGLYYYLKGVATGHASTAQSVLKELPEDVRKRITRLKPTATYLMEQAKHQGEQAGEALGLRKAAYTLQGHKKFQGLPISIENRKGSVRKGVDKDGKPWKTVFKLPYGYITGPEGNDGEEIDVYVGPDKGAPNAYVIHQRKLDGKGYDEDKVMLGFKLEEDARRAYLEHYNSVGKKLLGPISTITVDELRRRLDEKRKHKKLAAVDPSNTTLYTDNVGAKQPKKAGDFPDMEGSDSPASKLAWDGVGSTGSPLTSSTMARIDSDEKPDRAKSGDVPSRDGTSPGSALTVKHEAGPDFMTTLPTAAATADAGSQSGATTRM